MSRYSVSRLNEVQILFSFQIYFAKVLWSAKFILRRCFGVQNLFCEGALEQQWWATKTRYPPYIDLIIENDGE